MGQGGQGAQAWALRGAACQGGCGLGILGSAASCAAATRCSCIRLHISAPLQGNEWEEKWGEKYWSAGRAEKWADKWGREGGDIWHEKWGESYDGAGALRCAVVVLCFAAMCCGHALLGLRGQRHLGTRGG